MASGKDGGALFWRLAGVVAVVALAGAVIHLHGKIADLEERAGTDSREGGEGGAEEILRESSGGRGSEKDAAGARELKKARLEAMLANASRRPIEAGGEAPDRAGPEREFEPHESFREAMGRDGRRYSPQECERIEDLYRRGNEGFDTSEGREALERLVESFPESNRAGCAASNLGAHYLNEGDLESAASYYGGLIEAGSGAVFENGEKVLPKALLNYGEVLRRQGDSEGADAAWGRIAEEFADEVDGEGIPYGDLARDRLGIAAP